MDRFKKAVKCWFAWDSERIEDYLEDMSSQGWHVVQMDGMLIHFLFERGERKRIRYCMDYQREDKAEYQQIFRDAGWSLLHKSMGWYVWSREYDGERPAIYTDTDSLVRRNRNLMAMIIVVLTTQVPMISINYMNLSHVFVISPVVFGILAAFLAVVYSFLAYCMVRLVMSIRRLKRKRAI